MNIFFLAFLHTIGFTQQDLKKIFLENEYYEDFYKSISYDILVNIFWNKTEKIKKILSNIDKIDTEDILKLIQRLDIVLISIHDARYPEILKPLNHSPFFLYVRWNVDILNTNILAIVWSRKHSPYAKKILEDFIPILIKEDFTIISGGAYGIDTLAHEITIQTKNNGKTLVVFGTGIDRCYPAKNKTLFEDIIKYNWALISHFPLGTWPEVYNFPIRNEIVAWMSKGIIIPEAWEWSGTLITAQLWIEHGRDIFVIPWDIYRESSKGSNSLLTTGQAKCVWNIQDILEEYILMQHNHMFSLETKGKHQPFQNSEAEAIYSSIENGYWTVDAIQLETDYSTTDILMHLSILEIEGHIENDKLWGYYVC